MPEIVFDGGRLAGTLTEAANPVAAALLITGSGPIDRDSNRPGLALDITKSLATALGAAGVTSLRYDKRGIGASQGDYYRVGFTDRLTDARIALTALAEHASGPLLAVGHSEGALHAVELAADGSVAGAALLWCGAGPGADILTWQTARIVATFPGWLRATMRLVRADPLVTQPKRLARIRASDADVMRVQGTRIAARWLREFADYDPTAALSRIEAPVLALTGANDLQVPPEDVETIGNLVRGPFEGHIVPELSHLLRPDPKRAGPRGYRRSLRDPVSPAALAPVAAWVREHW
ncbi:alpha/beta fold hydrolase [Nocardia panacis]|uniref:Alpha/beta fold hydrolase n=1 Tax=Nocardia panacis TaxID=2340916 RepID=A0A3A4K6M3_9NOCA|nr:alpha/beta fold hydrolase [Nocardia panacis]RJO72961.1 alpha/beta fold hydrolase [Nocardia panacis]